MVRSIYTAFFMFVFTMSPLSIASAVELHATSDKSSNSVIEKEDKGFSYELAGNAEEEGALKLFVKNTTSEHEIFDINADDLNRIAPAAGIKIQFEF